MNRTGSVRAGCLAAVMACAAMPAGADALSAEGAGALVITSSTAHGGGGAVIEATPLPHDAITATPLISTNEPPTLIIPASQDGLVSHTVSDATPTVAVGTVQVSGASAVAGRAEAALSEGGATVDFVEMPTVDNAGLDDGGARSVHVSALLPGTSSAVSESAAGGAAIRGGHLVSGGP